MNTGRQNILYTKVLDSGANGMPRSLEFVVNADPMHMDKQVFMSAIKNHRGLLTNFARNGAHNCRCTYEHAVLGYANGKPTLPSNILLELGNIWTWTPLENDITI